MNKKICVYTCITGDYDNLRTPEVIEKNIDYYCFTNNNDLKSDFWKIIHINDEQLSNVVLSRKIKILGHEEINGKYDIYVWMDARITPTRPINDFIEKYCDFNKHDYFVFKHSYRNSIKEEIVANAFFGIESIENLKKLEEFYKKQNYNYDNGLTENTIIIRKDIKIVEKTMNKWFDMLLSYSFRDQLSFNYVAKITDFNFKCIDLNIWDNEWFKAGEHKKQKNKYRIHFKEKETDSIEEYKYGDTVYNDNTVNSDKFHIEVVVPRNIKIIDIDISFLSGCVINKIIFNIAGDFEYQLLNSYTYSKKVIPSKNGGCLRLVGNFKKRQKIIIDLELNLNQIEFFNNYINDNDVEKQEIIKKYNEIVNSKRWKIINKIFKIFGR